MKNKEIKKLSSSEAKNKIGTLKKDLFNFRFRKTNEQLTDTAKVSEIKKDIARLLTVINKKKTIINKKKTIWARKYWMEKLLKIRMTRLL